MKNRVLNIVPTNDDLPKEWRGVRYEFTNGWALSVLLAKRGNIHECALLKTDGDIAYDHEDEQDLLYLTSQQVVRLVDYIQQNEDDTLQRVRAWLIFEGELAKIKS